MTYRQALLLSVPVGILAHAVLPGSAAAQNGSLNLYGSTSSVFVPYANGGLNQTQLSRSPSLSVGFNGSPGTGFTMDTGSTGIVVSKDGFTPPANAVSAGSGYQVYNSTGIKSTGTWWVTDVNLYRPNTDEILATARVPVLVVDQQFCLPHARACKIAQNTTVVPTGVRMFGIGFGQEAADQPGGIPAHNPLLNIVGTSTGGTPSHGYVLDTSGVRIGLTGADTQGFAMVKLAPNGNGTGPGGNPATDLSFDWQRAPATVVVNGVAGNGTLLMDTGVPGMFLTTPPNAVVQTFDDKNLECKTSCAVGGTSLSILMPGQTTPIAGYGFTLNRNGQNQAGNALAPLDISVDQPGIPTYANTTYHFLNGFDYFYDYDNGFVGFRWNGKVDDQYGGATPSMALQGNFALADGFATNLPIVLTTANQAGTPTVLALAGQASLSGVITGAGGLTYAGGNAIVTGVNTYGGGTTVNGGRLSIAADTALGDPAGALFLNSGTVAALAPLSSARPIGITGNNAIATGGNGVVLSGAITGPGGLAIDGGGAVTLTGVNSYTGATVVNGSTLAVGSASLSGSSLTLNNAGLQALGDLSYTGALNLDGTADVIDAMGHQVLFSGPLSGSAALTTIGNVQLAGDLSLGGAHLVQQGTFVANGTLTAPSLAISAAGTLSGTGTINAPTAVAGTLAPGNSPGTITFNAPLTQLPGSTLAVEIDGTGAGSGRGNHDRVIINGSGNSFVAGGTLTPILRGIPGDASNTYTPAIGQSFVIVQAQGGVTGSFSGVTQPTAGIAPGSRFDVLYGATAVVLVVTPSRYSDLGAAGVRQTPGQAAVGTVLDSFRPAPGAAMSASQGAIYGPLYSTPAAGIPFALDQLGPSIYGSGLTTARDGWYAVIDTVGRHQSATRDSLPIGERSVWVTSLADFSATGNAHGVGYSATNAGVVAGIDMRPSADWTAGLAFGYLNLQASNNVSARVSGDAFHALAYGGWQQGPWFAEAQGGGFAMESDTDRPLGAWGTKAHGSTTGWGAGGSVRAGMRLPVAGWQVEPSVRLAGVGLSQGAVTESRGGPLALSVASARLGSVQSLVGVGASRPTQVGRATVVPSARIGWAHEFADHSARIDSALAAAPASFSVSTPGIGRDAAVVGVGADVQLASQLSFHLGYRGAFRANNNAQEVAGGLRYVW